jgi:ubiquinone/menaquinone biosynthesis C-methylase UbiE
MSPEMVDKARGRLVEQWPNAALAVEDGQALSFNDESFDAVLCADSCSSLTRQAP